MESIVLFVLFMIVNSDVFVSHVLSNIGTFTVNGQPNLIGAFIQGFMLVMLFTIYKTYMLN